MLLGQAAGLEIGAKAPIGYRRQQRAPDSPVESSRDARAGFSQRLVGAMYQRLERGPVVLRGGPRVALPELGSAEPIGGVDQDA
ncbi:MAG TPA: hypothetical protein VFO08_18285 [Methylomirabilota bacterium]|nr:hypothetical protein [Methylomirabilota bacterium]